LRVLQETQHQLEMLNRIFVPIDFVTGPIPQDMTMWHVMETINRISREGITFARIGVYHVQRLLRNEPIGLWESCLSTLPRNRINYEQFLN